MQNLSRGAWLAIAAVAAIPTTIAIAKTADRAGWQMTPETRSRLEDGRLAMAKVALRLNADQEKLWAPVEQQVRDTFKAQDRKIRQRRTEASGSCCALRKDEPEIVGTCRADEGVLVSLHAILRIAFR